MASAKLETLRNLLQHYEQLHQIAAQGNWSNVDRQAPIIATLFSQLENAAADIEAKDKSEAAALIKRILEANAAIQLHTSSWLQDVAPLLKVLNRQP